MLKSAQDLGMLKGIGREWPGKGGRGSVAGSLGEGAGERGGRKWEGGTVSMRCGQAVRPESLSSLIGDHSATTPKH